jgi:hypothetical protein
MGNPDHEEWDECRTLEEALDLVEVECFRCHCGRLLWQICDDSTSFIL